MATNELVSAVNMLNYDIVVDEEALKKARDDMKALFDETKKLVSEMLDVLADFRFQGMNTPTGEKIYNLFLHQVYEPFADLYLVAEHVCSNLDMVCVHFQEVFNAYRILATHL